MASVALSAMPSVLHKVVFSFDVNATILVAFAAVAGGPGTVATVTAAAADIEKNERWASGHDLIERRKR